MITGDSIYQPSILDGLRRIVDLIRSFEDLDALKQPLPGTSVSINDLLGFADKLDATLDQLQRNPSASLQQLESALEAGLGIPDNRLGAEA